MDAGIVGGRRGLVSGALVIVAASLALVASSVSAEPAELALACPEPIPDAGFDDVEGNTHETAIQCLAAWELTQGVDADRFAPDRDVPRAQMATFLVQLLEVVGVELPVVTAPVFTDVGGVHANNIEVLAELGITRGRTPGVFAPSEPVTREQMASFVAGVLETVGVPLPDVAAPFDDVAGSVHASAIGALADLGVVRGVDDQRYDPSGSVSRAQMASMLMRAVEVLVDAGFVNPPYPDSEVLGEVEDRDPVDGGGSVGAGGGNAGTSFRWIESDMQFYVEQHASTSATISFYVFEPIPSATLRLEGSLLDLTGVDALPLGDLSVGTRSVRLPISAPLLSSPGTELFGSVVLMSEDDRRGIPLDIVTSIVERSSEDAASELLAASRDRVELRLSGDVLADQLTVFLDGGYESAVDVAADVEATVIGSSPEANVYQFLISTQESVGQIVEMATDLIADDRVETATPSRLIFQRDGTARLPGVSRWERDWYQDPPGRTWHLEAVNLPQAWSLSTGVNDPVGVAIFDGGFDSRHWDIDFSAFYGEEASDWGGIHGNMVTGVACADGTNGRGIVGAAWACDLHGYSIHQELLLDQLAVGEESMVGVTQDSIVAAAMTHAASSGIRVANMSFGLPSPRYEFLCQGFDDLPLEEQSSWELSHRSWAAATGNARTAAADAGYGEVLWIAATGNNGCGTSEYDFPSAMASRTPIPYDASLSDSWISVAATNNDGEIASYSDFAESRITVAAPGGEAGAYPIETTGRCATLGLGELRCGYDSTWGTSFAAPMVTGTAALMFSANPGLSAAEARSCIVGSTQGRQVPGQQFGIVDAYEAVRCAMATGDTGGPTPGGPRGSAMGDPHLVSFDGLMYDMHAEGEFRLVESLDDDFAVHVRTEHWGHVSPTVSTIDEVAIRTPEDEVIVYTPGGVTVDGAPIADGASVDLDGGGVADAGTLVLADGTTVSGMRPGDASSVIVELSGDRSGHVQGLLGDGDGDPANDGTAVDGGVAFGPGTLRGLDWEDLEVDLYDNFVEGWIPAEADRIFPGALRPYVKPTGLVTFDSFAPDARAAAQTRCEANGWVEPELSLCVFDVLVTGDERFADPELIIGLEADEVTSTGNEPMLDPDVPPIEGVGSIAGVIADADGNGQSGMCINADGYAYAGHYSYGSATSQQDGSYTLADLPIGRYRVRAWDCEGLDRVAGYHPDRSSYGSAVQVEVPDQGTLEDVDLLTVQGGSVSGTVTRLADGAAVNNVCVAALPIVDGEVSYRWVGSSRYDTDGQGRYHLGSLLPGDYLIRVNPCRPWLDSSDMVEENLRDGWSGDALSSIDAEVVTVSAGETTPAVDIALVAGAIVTGEVSGPDGPADQICVSAYLTDDTFAAERFTITGSDGTYSLTGLPPGEVQISWYDCGESDLLQHDVLVSELGATETRQLAPIVLDQGGRIVGEVVLDSPGRAFPVCVGHEPIDGGAFRISQILTGMQFQLRSAVPGDGYLSVRDCDTFEVLSWWEGVEVREAATPVQVTAGEEVGPFSVTVAPLR